jgi:hypothetical protein
MTPSLRRTLVWQALGMACYLLGIVLFLLVAVEVFLGGPEPSLASVSGVDTALMAIGVALIIVGQLINWKRGGAKAGSMGSPMESFGNAPKKTRLEELGYHLPPESSGYAYEDGDVYVVCENCGAKNDDEFRFCGGCSAELPD